jgi:hypothetical protein
MKHDSDDSHAIAEAIVDLPWEQQDRLGTLLELLKDAPKPTSDRAESMLLEIAKRALESETCVMDEIDRVIDYLRHPGNFTH